MTISPAFCMLYKCLFRRLLTALPARCTVGQPFIYSLMSKRLVRGPSFSIIRRRAARTLAGEASRGSGRPDSSEYSVKGLGLRCSSVAFLRTASSASRRSSCSSSSRDHASLTETLPLILGVSQVLLLQGVEYPVPCMPRRSGVPRRPGPRRTPTHGFAQSSTPLAQAAV